ncbi:hypothetical protein G4B88_025308 [Cannabis sativa]|uniref:Uncharacterized protein n=1 Tax=Cannabis sativa TaxID=3483 RepID=A0A7J6EB80_CANSA|nr:hypothetical protein G4B88_025308 [Cannabis sativa]
MSDKIVSIIDRMHRYPFGLRSNDEASKKELEKLQKEKSKLKEEEEKHSEEAGEDLHNMIALDFLELGSHSYNNRGFPSLTSMIVDGGQNVTVVDDRALARNGWVPIDLSNWHNADEVKLDMIWKEMKTTFDLDDCVRHQTLSNIGNKWRGFKSRLTNNFIMKYMEDRAYRTKNPHTLMFPPAIYPGITQPVWHNFVATRTTPEFQELRRLQQTRRAANENPHRLGRKGYPNLEYEHQQQLDTEEEIERAVLWKEARKDKKERTPESYGRVRARGHNVGFKDCFPKSKGGVRSLYERQIIYENETRTKNETEIESLKKGTNDIENNFKAVMKALEVKSHGHQGLSTDIEAHFSPNIVQEREDEDIANDHVQEENVEHSVKDKNDYPNLLQDESNYPNLVQNESFIDVIVTPNEGTCSRLDLENLIDKQVAKGIIRQAAEVHNKPLEENDYRIEVNELLIPDALIPDAIDPDEIYLVKHVFRSYVAWPKHLVLLEAAILGRTPDDRAKDLAKRLGEIIPRQLLMAAFNDG